MPFQGQAATKSEWVGARATPCVKAKRGAFTFEVRITSGLCEIGWCGTGVPTVLLMSVS